MRVIERVMVYLDGSEEALTAAQYGILLSKEYGAELIGLYVINTKAISDLLQAGVFIASEQQEYQQDIESDADRYLNFFSASAEEKGVSPTLLKRSGSVYDEVKKSIKENCIDLLLIGGVSRRSRRDENLSDIDRVLRSAFCSVLVVRDEDRVNDLFDGEEG